MTQYSISEPITAIVTTTSEEPVEARVTIQVYDQTYFRIARISSSEDLRIDLGHFNNRVTFTVVVRCRGAIRVELVQGDYTLYSATGVDLLTATPEFEQKSDDAIPERYSESPERVVFSKQYESIENAEFVTLEKSEVQKRDRWRVDEEYTVWFVTDRRPSGSGAIPFETERDASTHYGQCTVFIPRSHKVGSLGSNIITRVLTGVDDRLAIRTVHRMDSNSYWQSLKESIGNDPKAKEALIFLHGYNVSFEEAALRSAQIGCDLSVNGPVAFFSWPSQGSIFRYQADETSIEYSEGRIREFLSDFVEKTTVKAVNIVAHSMGNRALLRAIDRIVATAATASGVKFNQIILAAPDIDTDTFLQLASCYGQVSNGTTLYVSPADKAVWFSKILHKFNRAGFTPPLCLAPGIVTVDVQSNTIFELGHSYFGSARAVLLDIRKTFTEGITTMEELSRRPWLSPVFKGPAIEHFELHEWDVPD